MVYGTRSSLVNFVEHFLGPLEHKICCQNSHNLIFRSLRKTGWIIALFFGSLSVPGTLHTANTWSPSPPASIPGASSQGELTTTYNATNGTVLATWIDIENIPTYAFWNGSSWSVPLPIPGANTVFGGLRTTYNATSGTVLATWLDGTGMPATQIPTYAVWAGGSSWASSASIPGAAAARSLTTTYDGTSGTVLVTWSDQTGMTPSRIPTYAVWAGGSSWVSAASIPGAGATADDANLTSAYNGASGTVLAIWVDNTTHKPTYAVWAGGSSWSSSSMDPPTSIPLSAVGAFDLTSTYDATSGMVLVTWLDGSIIPTYAAWAGGSSWVSAASIPGAVAAAAAEPNLTTTYNATSGTVVATWLDGTYVPTYAVWAGGSSWSSSSMNPPTSIPGASAATDFSLTTTYTAANGTVLATWLDGTEDVPIYAVWAGGSSWISAISIPEASPSGGDLTSAYDAANGTVLTTWIDLAGVPTYTGLAIATSRAFQRPANKR